MAGAWFRVIVAASGLALACGDEADEGQEGSSGSAAEQTATTMSPSTTVAADSSGTGAPDGAACSQSDECASGRCFMVPMFGGLCGECESDADCPMWGCQSPNPPGGIPSSFCGDGTRGSACESDEACEGDLICGSVPIASLAGAGSCGDCAADSDCDGEQLCSPLTVESGGQANACVAPGSVPDGESCNLEGNGDDACENLCVPVDIMGIVLVGVCSICVTDEDCPDGQTCLLPILAMNETTPGACR